MLTGEVALGISGVAEITSAIQEVRVAQRLLRSSQSLAVGEEIERGVERPSSLEVDCVWIIRYRYGQPLSTLRCLSDDAIVAGGFYPEGALVALGIFLIYGGGLRAVMRSRTNGWTK